MVWADSRGGTLPPASARLLAAGAIAALLGPLAACGGSPPERSERDDGRDARLLIGRWSGELRQAGLRPFRVRADIRSLTPSARNTVSYSGIECSGRWTYLGERGADHRFREVIDRGRGGQCKGVGEVSLRPLPAGRLRYAFRGGGVESAGVLTRDP